MRQLNVLCYIRTAEQLNKQTFLFCHVKLNVLCYIRIAEHLNKLLLLVPSCPHHVKLKYTRMRKLPYCSLILIANL